MAINFDAIRENSKGISIPPVLPAGKYQAKVLDVVIVPARPATTNQKARAESLEITLLTSYKGVAVPLRYSIYSWNKPLVNSNTGTEFYTQSYFLNPIRLHAGAPDMDLADALRWGQTNEFPINYGRNSEGYPEVTVLYPEEQAPAAPTATKSEEIPFNI